MENIGSVLSDYERDQPKRASGGIYALSGFNYQLRLYIAQLVESLTANGPVIEDAGKVFLEALSDIAVQKYDDLICIQAKRSLTKANLKDAAAEILAVDSFFEQKYPSLRSQVRFQLVASKGDSSVVWDDLPASHPARLTVELLLNQNRLEQPCIEPDPGWRAITAVWGHLKAPYDFVRFALDRALTRINSTEDAQRIRDDICERFTKDRNSSLRAGQLLVSQDFSPMPNPSNSLEIGREITLARVRDRQYMPRQNQRDALFDRLLECFNLSRCDLKPAVRSLWISGRSGAGKSVLLLQTVERLVAEGRRVLWLGGNAELLEQALREVVDAPEDLRPEFIAIDDLYDRDARTRLDLARLGAFIDEAGRQLWPLVVTCGPAEFADAFEEDSRYRGFELHRETVQSVSAGEALEIADWYRNRIGREPTSGPAFDQAQGADGGLFISLAVELAHGDLREFSQRFAARVRINDLDAALCLPLALNRLYLRAPYNWLSDTDREKLTTLNVEGDFKLLEPGQNGQVVRLTHPHLGDALYLALRRPANSQAYANDLIKIFERALQEKNGFLVSQLLRVFSSSDQGLTAERLAIVDKKRLAEGCALAVRANRGQWAWDADTAADIATSLACWASMHSEIEACLGDDLFDIAVQCLGGAFKAWPGCWSRLDICTPNSLALQTWATAHLPNEDFITHPRWSLVWEQCLNTAPDPAQWRGLGLVWLQRHLRRSDWHFVWKKLLPPMSDVNWDSDPALILGLRRLRAESDGPDWAYVMQDLLNFTNGSCIKAHEVATLGHRWLAGREDRVEWSFVWRNLQSRAEHLPDWISQSVLEQGHRWIIDREDRLGWSQVWRSLLEKTGSSPDFSSRLALLHKGRRWLIGREDCAEWGFIWITLLENSEHLIDSISLEELLSQAYHWLLGHEDRFEWTYVWCALMEVAEHLPHPLTVTELLGEGFSWLTEHKDSSDWIFVWRPLYEKSENLPGSIELSELLEEGCSWLVGKESLLEWPYVWQQIVDRAEYLPESKSVTSLLEYGYSWLFGRECYAGWNYIWRDLLQRAELLPDSISVTSLLEHGHRWLASQECYDEWGFVCEEMLDHRYNDTDFLDIAAHFLSQTMAERSWTITAVKFLVVAPMHPASSGFAIALTQRVIDCPNNNFWTKIGQLVEALSMYGDSVGHTIQYFCQVFIARGQAPAWSVARERLATNTVVRGKVMAIKGSSISVELEIGLLSWWVNKPESIRAIVGETREFYIKSISPDRDSIRISHAAPQSIDIGMTYEGEVIGQSDYGLFVMIGDSPGMIHHSTCNDFPKLMSNYPKGSDISVRVLKKAEKGLSLIYVDPLENNAVIIPTIKPGDELEGIIRNVVDFGLFIDLDDYNGGLLHRSNLPSDFQEKSIFTKGQVIKVQAYAVQDDGRILLKLGSTTL